MTGATTARVRQRCITAVMVCGLGALAVGCGGGPGPAGGTGSGAQTHPPGAAAGADGSVSVTFTKLTSGSNPGRTVSGQAQFTCKNT